MNQFFFGVKNLQFWNIIQTLFSLCEILNINDSFNFIELLFFKNNEIFILNILIGHRQLNIFWLSKLNAIMFLNFQAISMIWLQSSYPVISSFLSLRSFLRNLSLTTLNLPIFNHQCPIKSNFSTQPLNQTLQSQVPPKRLNWKWSLVQKQKRQFLFL